MKKIIAAVLAAAFVFAFASCGKTGFSYMEEDLTKYVTAGEFKNLTVTIPAAKEVTEVEVKNHAAEHVGHADGELATLDEGIAVVGQLVNIDYVGTIDGEEFDGGSAEDTALVLGTGTMIPGFEDGILGMAIGETKTVDVTFPEDYGNADLDGKVAKFEITLNAIYDDSVFDAVRAELEESANESFEASKRKYAWTAVVNGATVLGYPEAAVKKLANDLYAYYEAAYYTYIQYGITLDVLGITKDSCYEDAKNTFKEEMVLYSIAKANGYTVSDEEFEAKVASLAETQKVTPAQYKSSFSRQSVETKVLYEKVMADVMATATFVAE